MVSATTTFKLNVKTSQGTLTLPQSVSAITLGGRQSKVIVTDYSFGKSSRALYSTATVLFAGQIGSRDVLFLFGDASQQHEASIALTGTSSAKIANSNVKLTKAKGSSETVISVLSGVSGLITVWDSNTQLVLYSDADTAGTFFAPVIPSTSTSGDASTFKNFWSIGSNSSVLVGGPYLVRNATISGSTLALRGDLNASVALSVVAPPSVRSITWNGQEVETNARAGSSLSSIGGFVAQLQPKVKASSVKVPTLSNWKFANSLPEIQSNFSDADWTVANHTTTNIPFPPYYGDGRILYGCDYQL